MGTKQTNRSSLMSNFSMRLGFGISLAIGVIVSTQIISKTAIQIKSASRTIDVKGYAERPITSETGVWSGMLVVRSENLTEAYRTLEAHKKRTLEQFKSLGVEKSRLKTGLVHKSINYKRDAKGYQTEEISRFALRVGFSVSYDQADFKKLEALGEKLDQLNLEGIEFQSSDPQYYYPSDKMNRVKVELLGEATQSARERAEQFAANSNSKVGKLVSARQGIFQVTSTNSTEMSSYGVYDTYSVDKVVKIVVTLSYASGE